MQSILQNQKADSRLPFLSDLLVRKAISPFPDWHGLQNYGNIKLNIM